MAINSPIGRIMGIDLGTTNSAAAILKDGKPVIIPATEGTSVYGKAFPSVVAFTEDGQVVVGELAKQKKFSNLGRTIEAAKRKMGGVFKFSISGTDYSPQEVSAFILRKIKKDAEVLLGEKVDRAVTANRLLYIQQTNICLLQSGVQIVQLMDNSADQMVLL